MKALIKNIVLTCITAYGVILLGLYYFTAKFIYFPSRIITATPRDIGLEYDDIFFETADNLTLNGWYIPVENSRATLLFCHGNAGNISDRLDLASIFCELGFNVFIFDYRGYGKSEGKPTEEGTYLDIEAAWDYLAKERGTDPATIFVYGRSLGGPVAAYLAKNRSIGGLILQATFTSVREMAAEIYPRFLIKILPVFIKYPTAEYLRSVHVPVLIIHSKTDDLVPYKFGEQLFETAQEPKTFLTLSGSHNDDVFRSTDEFKAGMNAFLDTFMVK
ncbi:alpha/beta hydrolase [candidate division KSB1 bacterium]